MRNISYSILITLTALLAVSSVAVAEHESFDYVITVGNETLTFVRQPQTGYVLKTRDDIGSIEIVSRFLKSAGDVKISLIRGLGRKGISVVYNERPVEENDRTIKSLRVYNEVQYTAPLFSSNGETVAVIPEIVVRVRPGIEIEQVRAICETVGCTIIKRMEFTEQEYLIEVLGIDADAVFTTIEQLNQISFVEWACPNIAFQPKLCGQVIPNDEYFPIQWHLHNTGQFGGTPGADINALEAWEITTGDPNIVIAVADSGVDVNHPDLINNLVPGYDFLEDDDLPKPARNYLFDAHGTTCSGLIAARGNNGFGVAGVTWNCRIMPIRVWQSGANGSELWITWVDMAEAFRWAASHGADILSNSWGSNNNSPIFHSALTDITKPSGIGRDGRGCIVLFAAGNDSGSIDWTARCPEAIAVGATDHNDIINNYSNFGPELDIVGPGGPKLPGYPGIPLWTTDITGDSGFSANVGTVLNRLFTFFGFSKNEGDLSVLDYSGSGGTSSATPVVAGVAALILSVDPNLTNEEVKQILYRSAHDLGEPGWDQYYGWGRVDARAAVEMALNPHIYVDDDSPADFNNIQVGIDAANDGDTVLVAPGDYLITEPITFKGKAITVRSKAGPEVTTIRMSDSPSNPDRASVVIFENGETETSILDGFTITGGQGSLLNPFPGYFVQAGGGVFCSVSSPKVIGCIIKENHTKSRNQSDASGGGVTLENSSAVIINCKICNNFTAHWAGGVDVYGGSPTLSDCIISDNSVSHEDGQAGGLFVYDSSCRILRCTIIANSAPLAGGGIQISTDAKANFHDCLIADNTSRHIGGILCSFSSETTLTNCIITRNVADRLCGGIASGHDGKAIMTNCVITANKAGQHSGGVTSYDNSSITLKNCIVFGNTAPSGPEIGLDYSYYHTPTSMNISYSNIKGGLSAAHIGQGTTLTWEEGNIDVDPLFADPGNGDYHLKSQAGRCDPAGEKWIIDELTSPCIDAGDPNSPVADEPEPNGSRINMGAYGGTTEASKSHSL